jgi:hypothetical protein
VTARPEVAVRRRIDAGDLRYCRERRGQRR